MPNNDTSTNELRRYVSLIIQKPPAIPHTSMTTGVEQKLAAELLEDNIDDAVRVIQAWSDRRVADALQSIDACSKTMQSPYKPGTQKSVIYMHGAQDAHKVWHEEIKAALKKEDQKHE